MSTAHAQDHPPPHRRATRPPARSTRTAPVWDPATGRAAGRGAAGRARPTSTPPSRPPSARSRPGATSRSRAARASCSPSATLVEKHTRRARPDRRLRARQGARRRQGRGDPRDGGRRVRVRAPAAAQGRVLRPGLDRHRRVLVPPAARRVRRHHAVQLPGHGPDVDAPDGDRDREHVRAQAVRARPVGVATSSPSSTPRPACPTACSTSSTATRSPSTRCSTTPTSPPSRSSARRRSPATCTRRANAHGKRVQALGGAKNHAVVMPDADLDFAANHLTAAGYGSAGQRCMAISVAVAVGDAAEPLIERLQGEGARGQGRPGPRAPARRWARSSRRRARPDRRLHRPGRRGRRDAGRRRPRDRDARATASGSARRCSTT